MTEEELEKAFGHIVELEKENADIKDFIVKNKKVCKELAEEYRQRYNKDNENKLALNMFYHNVIAFNNYENILAEIENRNSEIMCFSSPPFLTEETVEINLKHIAELEKENAELKEQITELKTKKIPQLERRIASIRGCHSVDVKKLNARIEQVERLKKEIAELKEQIEKMKCCGNCKKLKGRFDRNTNINILYCSDPDMKQIEVGFQMCCCKWEIKEK